MEVKAIVTTKWNADMEYEGTLYKKGEIAIVKDRIYEVEEIYLQKNQGTFTYKDTGITVEGDYFRYILKGLPGSTAAAAFQQISELTESYV